jgi:hypothetical protein
MAVFPPALWGKPGRAETAHNSLSRQFDLSLAGPEPAALLFGVHVYFTLVVETLCAELLARARQTDSPARRLHEACTAGKGLEELELRAQQGDYTLLAFDGGTVLQRATRLGSIWSKQFEAALAELAAHASQWAAKAPHQPSGDLFGALYQALVPRPVRHALGEYYTPAWLVEHILDQLEYHGHPQQRLLDPACGSGAFLVAAIQRVVRRCADNSTCDLRSGTIASQMLANIRGCDSNPVAITAALANYRIAASKLAADSCWLGGTPDGTVGPVLLGDSILEAPRLAAALGRFDYVVGNPPWVVWDNLPAEYRAATAELWRKYGLFSLSARQARHGGGKKDLAALMLYAAADCFLKDGGRLGMVIPQTLLHTKGAGDGFRRFRLGPEGTPLEVLRVDDLTALRPFAAANRTATIVLRKGQQTAYPVLYARWLPPQANDNTAPEKPTAAAGDGGKQPGKESDKCVRKPFVGRRRVYDALPAAGGGPGAPWLLSPEGLDFDFRRLIGPSDYVAHLGANSGGASGVYWVEIVDSCGRLVQVRNLPAAGKRKIRQIEALIEPELLYPLLRWGDVHRYRAVPSAAILLVQDVNTRAGIPEELLRSQYPKAAEYLQRFEAVLRARVAYRRYQSHGPYYSMYNVGPYTLAPWKVVWRRMDRCLRAAVVGMIEHPILGTRPAVPQETCVLVAADTPEEAHYLCAMLNSVVSGFLVSAHSVVGGKGFGTPSILDFLGIRRFDAADRRHQSLAALSRRAHHAAAAGNDWQHVQHRIDLEAAALYRLSPDQCRRIAHHLQMM